MAKRENMTSLIWKQTIILCTLRLKHLRETAKVEGFDNVNQLHAILYFAHIVSSGWHGKKVMTTQIHAWKIFSEV